MAGRTGSLSSASEWWCDDALIQRFICDLVSAEMASLRPTGFVAPPAPWSDTLDLVREFGVDSLELVALAGVLSEAFRLHESGIEDRLLVRTTIGDWVAIAREGLDVYSEAMTF